MKPVLRFLQLPRHFGVARMLALEEALLRHDASQSNWCVTMEGPTHPTIVLGLSGKPEKLLHLSTVLGEDGRSRGETPPLPVPDVLRRFTGGGTVVLGPGTCLCSLILRGWPVGSNDGSVSSSAAVVDPRAIMAWSEAFIARC